MGLTLISTFITPICFVPIREKVQRYKSDSSIPLSKFSLSLMRMSSDSSDSSELKEDSTSQWNLFKETFGGKWIGTSSWYNSSDWSKPFLVIQKAIYDISFPNKDNAIWRGNGLRFTENELYIKLNRDNWRKESFLFPGGFGGQTSLESLTKITKQFDEINFFDQKCRSMIISEYRRDTSDSIFFGKLQSIQITPFRDAYKCKIGKKEKYESTIDLLLSISGWKGKSWTYSPDNIPKYSFNETNVSDVIMNPNIYTTKEVCKIWEDNLICGLPMNVMKGKESEYIYGCKVNDCCFKQLKIIRDKENKLISWTFYIFEKS